MHELWIERGNKRSFLDRYLLSRLESFLIRRTDANIIAGYASGEELVRRYKIPKPVVVLNAPMYLKYTPSTIFRDKLKIPSGQKILLYAGIIGVSRGIEEIILSLKSLSDCCVVLLGYGPDYYVSKLKAFIDNSGVKDRVYLFGPVPSNEIVRYAMSADVGIVLQKNVCLNSYNASPNKLFEYMNAGLPVVGSNFPDIKRFVEGYSFGVTCNPESIQDIISAVQYVLADKGRYEKMRRNALKIAKVYNWENESHKIVAIYDRLAKEIMKTKLPK
jgi:glycosyltransferase involved in cell wall biosynthesis